MLENILPYNGEVYDYGIILNTIDASNYFNDLLQSVDWQNDEAFIFGKHYVTKRKVAWYGDSPIEYTYSKSTKKAMYWTNELSQLKKIVENITKENYNSCLCNLYHDGDEGMAWHSDDEKKIVKYSSIASLTFGATRRFGFKHKKDKTLIMLQLNAGQLIEMKGETQLFWWHRLPKTKQKVGPRINLTFRKIEL